MALGLFPNNACMRMVIGIGIVYFRLIELTVLGYIILPLTASIGMFSLSELCTLVIL